jgi:hypothetical protein
MKDGERLGRWEGEIKPGQMKAINYGSESERSSRRAGGLRKPPGKGAKTINSTI